MNEEIRLTNENRKKFFMIDNEIVEDDRLDGYDLSVYCVLAFHENKETGKCFPAHKRFTELIGFSKDRVIKSLKKLEDCGYITIVHETGKSNHYILRDAKKVYRSYLSEKSTSRESLTRHGGVAQNDKYQSLRTTGGVAQNDTNNTNNKTNNNNTNIEISDKSLNAQSTLFDIHKSVQSESVQSSAKKKKTQRELAWEKIEQARSGIISWEKVRPRDFTYYFVDKHNELLSGQPLFQPYKNGTYVKLFRENFIEAYNIPNDKVCEYIDEFLNQYKTHPKSWGYITWGMIEKHKPLMDEIMYHVQKALRVVERQFEYNSFGLKEKTNLSNSERSDEVF